MKKILIAFIFLVMASPVLAAQQVGETFKDLGNMQEQFFQSAIVPGISVKTETAGDGISTIGKPKGMPYFKKMRLKAQRALKKYYKISDEKQLQKEKEKAINDANKSDKSQKENKDFDIKYLEYEGENATEINVKSKKTPEVVETTSLVGEVKEQITEKEMTLDADDIKMNDDTGDMEALGNPILVFPQKGIRLTSDKMIYNRDSNILKAIGHVVLTKDGKPVYGEYLQVNMNEENIFMDKVVTAMPPLKIRSRKAVSDNNVLTFYDGVVNSDENKVFNFKSKMIGPDFSQMVIREEDKAYFMKNSNSKLKLSVANVYIDSKKEHEKISFKDAEVYHNDKYLFTMPSFTAYTNKGQEYIETNIPEFGSQSNMGMFGGPGIVFEAPFGSIIKVLPMLNYKDGIGFGGAVKYMNTYNTTQFMYGSAAATFMLNGRQELDDNLFLQYAANSYVDDWFMGARMPKYLAELVYDKTKITKDFLAEKNDLSFRHKASLAYAHDGDWNMYRESIQTTNVGTMRFKYMAEANQTFYKYEDIENRKLLELGLVLQGSAAVYGTGDTQFIGRIGPRVHTQYKYWMQDLGFFMSGFSDQTPMPVFDMYRYGHSNLYIKEAIRLHKYLSLGWSGSVTMSNDSPNGEMFQENAFIFSVGPDDFKLNFGYDIMRKRTFFAASMLLNTKGSSLVFDKMEIKNPERLGSSEKEEEKIFEEADENVKPVANVLQYAEVVDIEDPDKEKL